MALRPVTPADLPILYQHQADPVANRLAAVPARGRDDFLAHWARLLGDPSVWTAAIVTPDGALAGTVLAFDRAGLRELGYWIGRAYWGRGLASEAVAEALQQERARPLYAGVARHNLASLRIVEKHGFRPVRETMFADPETGAPVAGVLLRLDP